jgi:hypothetical protein
LPNHLLLLLQVVDRSRDILVRFDKEYREWLQVPSCCLLGRATAAAKQQRQDPWQCVQQQQQQQQQPRRPAALQSTPNFMRPTSTVCYQVTALLPAPLCSLHAPLLPPSPALTSNTIATATATHTLSNTAWGDEHDAFKELATTVGESDTSLLVVGVPISNSDTYPVNTKLSVSEEICDSKICQQVRQQPCCYFPQQTASKSPMHNHHCFTSLLRLLL